VPARKPYRRSSVRQQPRIYRGPAVNELIGCACYNNICNHWV